MRDSSSRSAAEFQALDNKDPFIEKGMASACLFTGIATPASFRNPASGPVVRHKKGILPKRLLYQIHRWAGIGLALFMFVWFLSGLVIMYAGPSALGKAEQLAHRNCSTLSSAG
jgi:hypothetical protein